MAQIIQHRGTVKSIEGSRVDVQIIQQSACSSCVAKNMCNSSESKEKVIEVYCDDASQYNVGDEVMLHGTLEMSMKAVWMAYGLPLVLVVLSLIILIPTLGSERLGALTSLLVLAVYYLLLYLRRDKLTKQFMFKIKNLK